MRQPIVRITLISAVPWLMVAVWLTGAVAVDAQSPSAKPASNIARTSDGQPDMRGIWLKAGGHINEANAPNRRLTTECREFFGLNGEPTGFDNTEPKPKPQYEPDPPRSQGIVDPADRVLPWRPEAAAWRADHFEKMMPPRDLEHVELTGRCAPPGPWHGGPVQIVQRPGAVVMLYENSHGSRVIHLDGRPPLGSDVKLFMGHSRGRWEGNTLVVETTNLNGEAYYDAFGRTIPWFSDSVRTQERFTVMARDRIDYEIVYEDPMLFTRPFKSVGYFFPADDGYELREETCVEGSYTLKNIFGF